MSKAIFVAAPIGMFVLGAAFERFIGLPGAGAVCINALPFSAIGIMIAVLMCVLSQLILYRTGMELRMLGAELRQTLNENRMSDSEG